MLWCGRQTTQLVFEVVAKVSMVADGVLGCVCLSVCMSVCNQFLYARRLKTYLNELRQIYRALHSILEMINLLCRSLSRVKTADFQLVQFLQ